MPPRRPRPAGRPRSTGRPEMLDGNALAGRLARLFTDRLHTEVPAADTDLFETGILDSLRFVELLRSEEHTSELQSHSDLVCRLLLEKKKKKKKHEKRDNRTKKISSNDRVTSDLAM